MPLYKFRCDDCGNEQSILTKFETKSKEAAKLVCEKCNGTRFSEILGLVIGGKGGNSHGGSDSGCSTCSGSSCSTCSTS